MMKRRDFVSKTLAVGTAALAGGTTALASTASNTFVKSAPAPLAAAKAKRRFKLNYAPHFGMFKNLWPTTALWPWKTTA
jgi:hydroxypyruvate isomerase